MPKKGVFGMKEMPLDVIREPKPPKPPDSQPMVTITKADGGFKIYCGRDPYTNQSKEYVRAEIDEAIALAKEHLSGGRKYEDKD